MAGDAHPEAGRQAAFFDVDRTLIAGSSGLRLAAPLRSRGLISARQLARTLLVQLTFAARGSDHEQLDRFTDGARELMRGWPHDQFVALVADELERRVHPMVYREALQRVAQHQAQGMAVYAVSATMEEIIGPLAELLGFDGAVATQMEVVDGRFSGEILRRCHGDDKAVRLREFAAEHGIDLARSVAYSDSITDAQFLRAVGRAYAVNPDRELRELAMAEGWGILRFRDRIRAPLHSRRSARMVLAAVVGGALWSRRRRAAASRAGAQVGRAGRRR